MTRKRKLDIHKSKAKPSTVLLTDPGATRAIEAVKKSIDDLYELMNDKKEVDLSELTEQVKKISNVIDIKEQIASITTAIKDNKTEVKDVDFTEVIKAIQDNKPVVNVDLKSLEKAVIEVQQKIQESSVLEQAPEEFQPVRRVIKVGNRLVFDDQATPVGRSGGGGSGSSGGASAANQTSGDQKTQIVDPGGEVATVTSGRLDVNASVDTSTLATSAKQDTGNTSLASIKTDVDTLVTSGGGGYVRQDSTATIAKETGGNLATIVSNQTNATQQVKVTDGTNIANVLKSDGTIAGQNAQLSAGTAFTTSTLTLNSGSPATAWFDMANYSWVSVEILTNTTPATLTFQTSGDAAETNISTMALISSSVTTTGPVGTTTSATATFHGPRTGRYFRVNSNNGAGTTTLVITFFTTPSALQTMFIAQGGTWTVQPGNTANTTPWLVKPHDGTTAQLFLPDNTDATGSSATADKAAVSSRNMAWGSNAAAWHRQRTVENASDSTGTGITAAGILAQFDDTSPGTVTENRFGNVRMSVRREIYNQIRDAAGNERGVNVDAANQLQANAGGVPGTVLNTYAVRPTTNTTNTPTSTTCYISSITISTEVAGTTSTLTIRDKQGTPFVLVNALTTVAATLTPTILNFQTPIKMTSGIDVITAGAAAETLDIWINYYQ